MVVGCHGGDDRNLILCGAHVTSLEVGNGRTAMQYWHMLAIYSLLCTGRRLPDLVLILDTAAVRGVSGIAVSRSVTCGVVSGARYRQSCGGSRGPRTNVPGTTADAVHGATFRPRTARRRFF